MGLSAARNFSKSAALLVIMGCAPALGGELHPSLSQENTLTASTITVNGTGSACFSADNPTLLVNCTTHAVSAGGAAGLSVTYGLSAGSSTITNEIVTSTLTVKGNAFSVGGSTFIVSGGSVAVGQAIDNGFMLSVGGNLSALGHTSLVGEVTSASTMTILGSAMSVGGSSFTVVGGSATVAYGLTAGNANITQSGAALSVPNGNASIGGTLTVSSYGGTALGFEQVIATATLTGAGTYTFSNLSSSYTYHAKIVGTMASGSGQNISWQLNGDTGNNYYLDSFFSNHGTTGGLTGTAAGACHFGNTSNGHTTGDWFNGEVTVAAIAASSTTVSLIGITGENNQGSLPNWVDYSCAYENGSATLNSLTFISGSGTVNARVVLYRDQITFP